MIAARIYQVHFGVHRTSGGVELACEARYSALKDRSSESARTSTGAADTDARDD